MKKTVALMLLVMLAVFVCTAMAEDTITVMVPPVSGTYLDDIDVWAAEFMEANREIKIEVIKTSWEDHSGKLQTMAAAGEAPDIAEVSYSAIGSFVDLGVGIEIDKYLDPERLADYDQNALDYMSIEGSVYGLPLYITIQAIGGNKEMLEAAGADIASIQANGWTLDEFMEVIKNGTKGDTFGFVFANSGVTASDFLNIFGVSAGMTNAFNDDLKYTYTSDNMLKLLEAVESMTKSGYMPNYGVEAGKRLVMCETGNAMIFGKAMPLFELNIRKNNAAIDADDGTAVADSIKLDYVFLPVPTMEGMQESCFGSVDGLIALRNNKTTDEHLKNVAAFLDYLCSGERAAIVDAPLLLKPVCESGREAYPNHEVTGLDEGNAAAAARAISLVIAPPAGVTAEQSANAKLLMDETIVPKFQALLAGEITARDAFDAIKAAALEVFDESDCVFGDL